MTYQEYLKDEIRRYTNAQRYMNTRLKTAVKLDKMLAQGIITPEAADNALNEIIERAAGIADGTKRVYISHKRGELLATIIHDGGVKVE